MLIDESICMSSNEYHLSYECFLEHSLYEQVSLPNRFINELNQAHKRLAILHVLTHWSPFLFNWDRASVVLAQHEGYLNLVSAFGSEAIANEIPLPIDYTLVGRVFKTKRLIICKQLSLSNEQDCRMLAQAGLVTCMDAPIIYQKQCVGTLNVARFSGEFTKQEAIKLFYIADLLGSALHLCKD